MISELFGLVSSFFGSFGALLSSFWALFEGKNVLTVDSFLYMGVCVDYTGGIGRTVQVREAAVRVWQLPGLSHVLDVLWRAHSQLVRAVFERAVGQTRGRDPDFPLGRRAR